MTTPYRRPTFASLVLRCAADPWALLACALAAGATWAVGLPLLAAGGVGAAVLGTAATVAALTGNVPAKPQARTGDQLRAGTPQATLLEALDAYIGDLNRLRAAGLDDLVTDPAIEALSAAEGSRETAARVAVAIEGLDAALARSETVNARWTGSSRNAGINAAEQRMAQRRQDLLAGLDAAVGEVAEVYTKLLELSATVEAATLAGPDGTVAEVNASLDSLRTAFGSLEQSARTELA